MDPHNIPPWWERIGKILAYPFNSHGLIAIAFLTAVDIFRGFSGMGIGIIGWFAYLGCTGIIVSVLFSVIRRSADGYEDFPLVDFGGDIFGEWILPAIKFVLMGVALFAPAIAFGMIGGAAMIFGGDGGGGAAAGTFGIAMLCLAVAFFLYPLATVILAMSESLINSLNPIVWFQILSRVFPGYMGVVLPAVFLSQSFVPLPGPLNLFAAPIKIYLAVCGAHLLGWFIFQHHQTLGHNPRIFSERQEVTAPQVAAGEGPHRPTGSESFQQPVVNAPQIWGEDPDTQQPAPERALDLSVPDEPEPQYGGAFSGTAPQGPHNQQATAAARQEAAPGWDPFAGVAEPKTSEPQAWDPFAGAVGAGQQPNASGGNGSFIEVDDAPVAEPAPEPEPEPVPEPEPQPVAPVAPALDEETQAMVGRFQADVASGNEQAATLSAALLIHKLWKLRRVERTNQTFRELVAAFPNACLRPDDQIKIARQLDALGDAATALCAWRALVMVHAAHPQSPRALLRCAEIYQEMGHADYARQCLKGVIEKYPNNEVSVVAQTRLKQMA